MNRKSLPAIKMDADQKPPSTLTSAIKSTILLFLVFFPLSFLHLIVHEGGHALVNLVHNVPDTIIYVHPFSFIGFSRPVLDWSDPWLHALGPIVGVLLPLLIFVPLWKRRSVANLFLVMLFPWSVFWGGLGIFDLLSRSGDLYNLSHVTGLPASLFMTICIILLVVGIFFTISLLPLLGLKPENRSTVWILPVGMILWALLGFGVAHWIVPGSPIDVKYHLAPEILQSANFRVHMMAAIGIVLSLIYVTLYRYAYRKLPVSLRTETKELAWRDLRVPAVLCVVSVVIGLILIK